MNKRLLGNTNIYLSELGYGAAALFGKNVLGKQGITEEQAMELIFQAVNKGVTFFDTGFNYGYSEERLGRCLDALFKDGVVGREDLVIETKCGETLNDDGSYGAFNWSPDWIKKSIEISLKRLKLDYVDLFAMHGGSVADCSDQLLNCFSDMKSQGIIRAFGINTFSTNMLEWIAENPVFDYVMLDYNIIKQDREPIIQRMQEQGVGVIAGMALGQSLFAKNIFKVKNRNDFWYLLRTLAHFRNNIKISKSYEFLKDQKDYTANQLALRYVLDNSNVSSAVFSTINVDHLLENFTAAEIVMPEKVRNEIKLRA